MESEFLAKKSDPKTHVQKLADYVCTENPVCRRQYTFFTEYTPNMDFYLATGRTETSHQPTTVQVRLRKLRTGLEQYYRKKAEYLVYG